MHAHIHKHIYTHTHTGLLSKVNLMTSHFADIRILKKKKNALLKSLDKSLLSHITFAFL